MIARFLFGRLRTIGARSIASSMQSNRTFSASSDNWNWLESYWEEEVWDYLNNLENDSSYNPGQQAIITENRDSIESYLLEVQMDYNPDDFISYLEDLLGDEKFNALSETWQNLAEALLDSWDHSIGGEGVGLRKYAGVVYDNVALSKPKMVRFSYTTRTGDHYSGTRYNGTSRYTVRTSDGRIYNKLKLPGQKLIMLSPRPRPRRWI